MENRNRVIKDYIADISGAGELSHGEVGTL